VAGSEGGSPTGGGHELNEQAPAPPPWMAVKRVWGLAGLDARSACEGRGGTEAAIETWVSRSGGVIDASPDPDLLG